MPDNSFEHNLSQQMEDFNYPASEAVWQKLEANLQKRKKRRWAFIWFFSGLMLVSTGLYFFTRPSIPNMNMGVASNSIKSGISETMPVGRGNNDTVRGTESNKEEPFAQVEPGAKVSEEIPATKDIEKSKPEIDVIVGYQKGKPAIQRTSNKKDIQHKEVVNNKSNGNAGQIEQEKISSDNIVSESSNQTITEGKKEEALPVLKKATDSESNNLKQEIEHPVANSGSVIKVDNNQKQTDSLVIGKTDQKTKDPKRHLLFGLRFEAGRSANSESNFAKTKSADMVSSPSTGAPPVNANPFTQEPSFAWSFGAWLRKPISQKVNMQTGLSYHHYRTRASQGDSSNYTNTFHLLSIPVEMVLQLNKGKKLPVQWHFGIEPGWMVGSNAIVQDTSGFLFSDKRMYNRFQLGLQTGISFRLFQKSKHALELGPVFQYMLTPVFKSGSSYDGHLNFLGLRADWKIFKFMSK